MVAAGAFALLAACAPVTDLKPEGQDGGRASSKGSSECPEPGPEPASGGITSVEAVHGTTEVLVEVGLVEIDPDLEQEVGVTFATPEGAWSFDVGRWPRPDGSARIHRFFSPEEKVELPDGAAECGAYMITMEGVPCRGSSAGFDLDSAVVTVSVPRPCLENPEWVQVGVTALFIGEHDIVMSDVWGEHSDDGDLLPPLGDQLDAAPSAAIGCQERVPRHEQRLHGPAHVVVGKRWCIR